MRKIQCFSMRATVNLLAIALTALFVVAATSPTYQEDGTPRFVGDGRQNSKMAPNDVIKAVRGDATCELGGNHQCNRVCIDEGALSGSCVELQCVCEPEIYSVRRHNSKKQPTKMAVNDVISGARDATCAIGGSFHCANACVDIGALDGTCVGEVCICIDGKRIVASWRDRLCVTPQSSSTSCEMTCRFGHIRATTGRCGNNRCNCLQSP